MSCFCCSSLPNQPGRTPASPASIFTPGIKHSGIRAGHPRAIVPAGEAGMTTTESASGCKDFGHGNLNVKYRKFFYIVFGMYPPGRICRHGNLPNCNYFKANWTTPRVVYWGIYFLPRCTNWPSLYSSCGARNPSTQVYYTHFPVTFKMKVPLNLLIEKVELSYQNKPRHSSGQLWDCVGRWNVMLPPSIHSITL